MNYENLNIRNKKIFIKSADDINQNFILFHKSFCKLDNVQFEDTTQLVSFSIKYNSIDIRFNDIVKAYFYTTYFYNKGIYELLKDVNYDKYQILTTYTNIDNNKSKLYISLYIDKYYLLTLYDKCSIPKLLSLIICGKDKTLTIDNNEEPDKFQIKTCMNEEINNLNCEKYLKTKLFNYQKNNILWMTNIERKIELKLNEYDFINYTGYKKYKINSINDYLYFKHISTYNNTYKLIDISKIENQSKITFNGGVLCDEVGLGKTLSMFSLILQNPKNNYIYPVKEKKKRRKRKKKSNIIDEVNEVNEINEVITEINTNNESKATLIICPNRLVNQWYDEINKYIENYDIKILKLMTITQYKKCTLDDYLNADIILMGFTFMVNKRYLDNEESKIRLENILWYRLIIDEGHELVINKRLPKKTLREMKDMLYKFKSNYKWICSGTPLGEPIHGFTGILNFLCTDYGELSQGIENIICDYSSDIISKYFRYNSKQSVENEVVIPPIITSVEFLKQTKIEKAIYNSAKGNELQLIQLCTHVLISEYNNILNNELNLEKLQETMLKHFGGKIDKITKIMSNLELKIIKSEEIYNNKIIDIENKLKSIESNDLIQKLIVDKDLIYSKHMENIALMNDKMKEYNIKVSGLKFKKKVFDELDQKYEELDKEICPITNCEMEEPVITICGHYYEKESIEQALKVCGKMCPLCKTKLSETDIYPIIKKETSQEELTSVNKYGTKMSYLINYLSQLVSENDENRIIVFTQWDKMLKLVGKVLDTNDIKYITIKGNAHIMASQIRKFKIDKNIRIILLSSDRCSSGSNLTEATHIILLDTFNESKENAKIIEEQAIGRASRIGQNKNVQVKRIIMQNTIEHDYYIRNIS
jgi:SWI/SNF-related matrix-associated actin-dependent regulator of chromatin subfamily A3